MDSSDAWDNELMRRFAAHMGLRHEIDPGDATQVRYSLDLHSGVRVGADTAAPESAPCTGNAFNGMRR